MDVRTILMLIFGLVALAVIAARIIVVAKQDELLVVFRIAQLQAVYGPGVSIVIPFLDRIVRVKVDSIPGWERMSEAELKQRAAEVALTRSNSAN
jgi:regulator of protease activity HflC (stomatin/prohibitin superfamily)